MPLGIKFSNWFHTGVWKHFHYIQVLLKNIYFRLSYVRISFQIRISDYILFFISVLEQYLFIWLGWLLFGDRKWSIYSLTGDKKNQKVVGKTSTLSK